MRQMLLGGSGRVLDAFSVEFRLVIYLIKRAKHDFVFYICWASGIVAKNTFFLSLVWTQTVSANKVCLQQSLQIPRPTIRNTAG